MKKMINKVRVFVFGLYIYCLVKIELAMERGD